MKRDVILILVLVYGLAFFACSCLPKSLPVVEEKVNYADSLLVCKDKVAELQAKVTKDSLFRIEQLTLVYDMAEQIKVLNDSLKRFEKTPLMNEELFLKVYRYERILYYWNITVRNPSQKVFLNGWINRVLSGEEDKE